MSRMKGSGKYYSIIKIRVSDDIRDQLLEYSKAQKTTVSEAARRALMVFFYQRSLKKTGQK